MDGTFTIFLVVGFSMFFAMVVIIALVFARINIAKKKSNGTGSTQSSATAESSAEVVHPYLEKLRQKKAETEADKHALHVADARAHQHKGEEEHYEEIVGSLGDIDDEGCADLDGVRFIAHDIAYEVQNNENNDYSGVVKAMILGEILNEPRFKKPYRHR